MRPSKQNEGDVGCAWTFEMGSGELARLEDLLMSLLATSSLATKRYPNSAVSLAQRLPIDAAMDRNCVR